MDRLAASFRLIYYDQRERGRSAEGVKPEDVTSPPTWKIVGAKLGAIPCGRRWTATDARGPESPSFQAVWTPVDTHGQRLEIYGSGGWVFESPRAR